MSLILLGILNSQAAAAGAAGAYDLLETTTLGTATASVTFDNLDTIAADYKHLQIRIVARSDRAAEAENVEIRFNDVTTSYREHRLRADGSGVSSSSTTFFSDAINAGIQAGGQADADLFGAAIVDILDFSSSSKNTTTRGIDAAVNPDQYRLHLTSNGWFNTAAITKLLIYANSGANFVAGTRFSLYGIKAGA